MAPARVTRVVTVRRAVMHCVARFSALSRASPRLIASASRQHSSAHRHIFTRASSPAPGSFVANARGVFQRFFSGAQDMGEDVTVTFSHN